MNENIVEYTVKPMFTFMNESELLDKARSIARARMIEGYKISSPETARVMVNDLFLGLEHERFMAVWLNAEHSVITVEGISTGTVNRASVYVREVIKAGLRENASAVVFAHNHPSGNPTVSNADIELTAMLKKALCLVDITLLDHFVVGREVISMAEKGLI